jgi:hypothetical protein
MDFNLGIRDFNFAAASRSASFIPDFFSRLTQAELVVSLIYFLRRQIQVPNSRDVFVVRFAGDYKHVAATSLRTAENSNLDLNEVERG